MFKIEKQELGDLRENHKKVIKKLNFEDGINPARRWYLYKNPLTQAFNYFIILIRKILPPCEIKNHLYRMLGVKIGKNVSIANDSILDISFLN